MNMHRKNDDDWTQTFTKLVEIQWATPQSKAQIRWASIKSSLNTRWDECNEKSVEERNVRDKKYVVGCKNKSTTELDSNSHGGLDIPPFF